MENRLISAIQTRLQSGTEQSAKIADTLEITIFSVRNALKWYKNNNLVVAVGGDQTRYVYAFNIQQNAHEYADASNNKKRYSPELISLVEALMHSSNAPKDRRIGNVIYSCMKKGKVTAEDYEKIGAESRMYADMKFGEQLGLVKRIGAGQYQIMQDLTNYEIRLEGAMKNTLTLMYDLFGEDAFSAEMAIAKLDYNESHMSATLHQLTWLKILDCSKGENNRYSYQFIVNPTDNPECFESAA